MKFLILFTLLSSQFSFAQTNKDEDLLRILMQQNSIENKNKSLKVNPKLKDLKELTPLEFKKDGNIYLRKGGFSSGGGGNSVVCLDKNSNISEINLLDYFEGIRKDQSLVKGINLPGSSLEEKIKTAFRRMEVRFPHLAKKLRNRALWVSSRMDNLLMDSKDGKLTPIYDMDLPFVPSENEKGESCQIVRFAVQLKKHVKGQKKFYFVKELFEHPNTSLTTKAGIILHEVIYEEAIKNGAFDSDFVRWLTYLISSDRFESMSDSEIQDLEAAPGAEFLSGFGINTNSKKSLIKSKSHNKFYARDNVYTLSPYKLTIGLEDVACLKVGLCQLFSGEYLGRKKGSSSLFPQYSIMMKNDIIKIPHSEAEKGVYESKKVRGEILTEYASSIASTTEGVCHPDGGCIGDLVGVNYNTQEGIVSYTGVIAGVFSEGDFAVQLIDGRFEVNGENVNPFNYVSRDSNVVLYADSSNTTIVE